jgi:hypothetical protein
MTDETQGRAGTGRGVLDDIVCIRRMGSTIVIGHCSEGILRMPKARLGHITSILLISHIDILISIFFAFVRLLAPK